MGRQQGVTGPQAWELGEAWGSGALLGSAGTRATWITALSARGLPLGKRSPGFPWPALPPSVGALLGCTCGSLAMSPSLALASTLWGLKLCDPCCPTGLRTLFLLGCRVAQGLDCFPASPSPMLRVLLGTPHMVGCNPHLH